MSTTPQERGRRDLVPSGVTESLPGLARVAAYAAVQTTGWSLRTSARAALRMGKAMTSQQEAVHLARDAGQAFAVVGELARSVSAGVPVGAALMSAGEALGGIVDQQPDIVGSSLGARVPAAPTLRERGQGLLERSRDVWDTDRGHPAYDRILDELAPDEARILLLLLNSGPQPSVDVRTGGPIGMVNSQLIAPGLNMIGPRAGLKYVDHTPAYLNNLNRLGLLWFSRESLRDPMEYQVVEAQPDVLEAMHSVKFAKVVRRSIHLTPFGDDFCRSCLIDEVQATREFPEHSAPEAGDPDEG
ncbi:Abi-alpha family protein [Nocardioides sp. R-C-SC26]|uniref:Abi-alpha family protein n=1 Tax=Nocardioides sp. R-C-SC26 TaxID=2870414 RepID=UPI001E29148A|nr:Abi-alpha family protein [Nocardioides sp. R-C-SC26]